MASANEVLHVGIDLGTSRSSISTSSGGRHVVDSYVGWPVDMVARKLIKKPVVIGREALDNRSMLDLHRPLERGLIKEGSEKDEAAVRELLSHLLAVAGKPTGIDITQEMRTACESLLAPIGETMLDLLSRVEPEYQEKVRQSVILSGGGGLTGGFGPRLEQALAEVGGGKVKVVKDPVFVGSDGGLAIALDAPDSEWEKLAG